MEIKIRIMKIEKLRSVMNVVRMRIENETSSHTISTSTCDLKLNDLYLKLREGTFNFFVIVIVIVIVYLELRVSWWRRPCWSSWSRAGSTRPRD